MKLTKDEVLENIDDVRKYVEEIDSKKDVKEAGFIIRTSLGSVIFKSEKTTCKEAVLGAIEYGANLIGADLRNANLGGTKTAYAKVNFSPSEYEQAKQFIEGLRR